MSIVKQKAVSSSAHATNLCNYIDSDKAIMRDSQNITNPKNWFQEMDEVREFAGHNKAARTDANNILMYHQILAFLPEEADLNGGKLSPQDCMIYAKQYANLRYPNQQIVFALHKEQCKSDGTARYAVHMAINRTDLSTWKRLDEGLSRTAKVSRANTVRDLDREWGLKQVEKDKTNSKLHKRQPRGAEKEMAERGEKSVKRNLRLWCNHLLETTSSLEQFCQELESKGFQVQVKNDRIFAFDTDHANLKNGQKCVFNLSKLDGDFSKSSLEIRFSQSGLVNEIAAGIEDMMQQEAAIAEARDTYFATLHERFEVYKTTATDAKGDDFHVFPKFKPPRPPEALRADSATRGKLLEYRSRAEKLASRYASNVPVQKAGKAASGVSDASVQPRRSVEHQRNDINR